MEGGKRKQARMRERRKEGIEIVVHSTGKMKKKKKESEGGKDREEKKGGNLGHTERTYSTPHQRWRECLPTPRLTWLEFFRLLVEFSGSSLELHHTAQAVSAPLLLYPKAHANSLAAALIISLPSTSSTCTGTPVATHLAIPWLQRPPGAN